MGLARDPRAPLTEAQFQRQITDFCDTLGLLWYHPYDSRKSNPGFPDLCIAGPRAVVYAELKVEDPHKGRVTKDQQKWIDMLRASGQLVFVWRPSDLEDACRLLTQVARGRERPLSDTPTG